jgi:hypothetical protein
MTTEEQEAARADLERCYRYMDRIIDIAQHEFPNLSPPEIVFVLSLLQWRYHDHIERLVARSRFPSETSSAAPSPTDVN